MGLPKGFEKTWQSGGRKPKEESKKRRARLIMLSDEEKEAVDKMRGDMSFSEYIRKQLGLKD